MSRHAPAVPLPQPLSQVLDHGAVLAGLRHRLATSQACLEAARTALPAALRGQVQAGPWDAGGWTLIAPNAAVAAKVRQWMPDIEQALAQAGLPAAAVRLHIAPAGGPR